MYQKFNAQKGNSNLTKLNQLHQILCKNKSTPKSIQEKIANYNLTLRKTDKSFTLIIAPTSDYPEKMHTFTEWP